MLSCQHVMCSITVIVSTSNTSSPDHTGYSENSTQHVTQVEYHICVSVCCPLHLLYTWDYISVFVWLGKYQCI